MAEPLLRPGASGEAVRELQQALKGVRHFQGDRGLTVDGVVGPRTWDEINALGD